VLLLGEEKKKEKSSAESLSDKTKSDTGTTLEENSV